VVDPREGDAGIAVFGFADRAAVHEQTPGVLVDPGFVRMAEDEDVGVLGGGRGEMLASVASMSRD
jgi:hypothetical protein